MTKFIQVTIPDRYIVGAKLGFSKIQGELQWDIEPELHSWLEENIISEYGIASDADGKNVLANLRDYEGATLTVEVFYSRYKPYVWFYRGEDAILFKLAWG